MADSVAFAQAPTASAAGKAVIMANPAAVLPKIFLTFRLGAQEYGIDAQQVQEIRGCAALTEIEDAPEFIQGAIDVRGAMVPVANLRGWFELNPAADSIFTVAIMLKLGGRLLGLMVDSVSDVIRLARRQIQPVPASWTGPDAQCLIGIGVDDERRLILLDLEKLMLGKGLESLEVEAC
jgi:purine-binding chemotaxis protein CheW